MALYVTDYPSLRRQPFSRPRPPGVAVDPPVVQAAGAALPELHGLGAPEVATPLLGHRLLLGVALLGLGVRRVEGGAVGHRVRLVRGPGTQPGAARPGR